MTSLKYKKNYGGLIYLLINLIIFLFAVTCQSQNIVIKDGDATEAFDSVPSDHTILFGCDGDVKLFDYHGDYTLPGDLYVGRSVVTIHGDLIYNGYSVVFLCDTSDLIITGETLSNTEVEDTYELKIYPNPASDYVNVNGQGISLIQFYNTNGQEVKRYNTMAVRNRIQVSNLNSGMYIIIVTGSNGRKENFKLIIK